NNIKFVNYPWAVIINELHSQAKIAEDDQYKEETLSKITRSLKRITQNKLKLIPPTCKNFAILNKSSDHGGEFVKNGH
ncbi:unnamed protein product, partial [Rotaria sp. Silwood1]